MNRFLKNMLLFLMPIIGISFLLDNFLSNMLRQNTTLVKGEYAVWNDIFDGKINSDIIIIGSSRAWVHFDPTKITQKTGVSSYNIGIDGHPFLLQYLRYNILRKYNKKPRLLLVSVESNSLSKKLDLYNHHQFLPYLRSNSEDLKEGLLQFNGFDSYDFKLPLVRFYGDFYIFKELLYAGKPTNRVRGFESHERKWSNDLLEAKKKFNSLQVKVDDISTQKFKKFIKENIEEEINVVLIYSPEFIEGQEFISNRDSIVKLYKKIGSDNKIPFIDFSKDSISYKKEYFYNATHLNKEGANLFTDRLIDTLLERELIPFKTN